jgi:hypothetical protein
MTEDQIRANITNLQTKANSDQGLAPFEEQELANLQQQLTDLRTAADDKAAAATANLPTGITQDNLSRFVETDADGNPIVKVDATTNQQYYDIREDLAGGEITDRRLGLEGVNTGVTSEQLTTRADAREKGFQGDMRDELVSNFVTDDAGRRGLVDPFGFQTALGQQKDIIEDPAGTMPAGSQYNVQRIQADAPGVIMDPTTGQVTDQVTVNAALAQATDATNIATQSAREYNALTAFDQIAAENMQAQQLEDDIRMVRAQQEEVDARSTVRGQLGILMSDFQGDQIPAWASASVRKAEQIMAARGLGASTIAGRSIAQAVQEAALPIAQRDAATFATFQQQNLSNRQQAELQNAANLLTVDIKNLDNRQQTAVLNTQNRVQARFTDQSEQNTARKINAASAQQNDQFYANFAQQVELANAAQRTAISQYNAGQANALEQFRLQNRTQRELFNAQNRIAIQQANTTWRRQVNTANTAAINAKNQFDAVNILNRSNTALNNYMQVYRDQADYIFTASENEKTRAYNTAVAAMQAEAAASASNRSGSTARALGGIFGNVLSAFAGTNSGANALINLIPGLGGS